MEVLVRGKMERLSEITDLNERQRWLDYLGRPDPRETNPVKVLYYGHSYVSHFQDYVATLPYYMANFGMSLTEACVHYKGLSGATVGRLSKKSNLNKINKMQAEIIVLEVGTNDLADVEVTPGDLCDQVIDLARELLDCRAREVIVSQVLLRGKEGLKKADKDFEEKVYAYNHNIERAINFLPRASFWHHYNLWKDIENHVEDGTHLNDQGHKKLYRSLKGALQSTITRIRPAWSRHAY